MRADRDDGGTDVDDFAALLTDPATTIAVVGATDDPAKYGGRIYRNLKGKGFRVLAVNPGRDRVNGDPCYPSLAALPETPTIVDVVVPPRAALEVLRQCVALGLERVWLQPGAEDAAVLDFAARSGLVFRAGDCVMVRTAPLPGSGRG
jgi:predicted CoA-binding protein